MVAAAFIWKQRGGGLMKEFLPRSGRDVFPKIEEPCDDALDIRIEDRDRLVESKSSYCRCRVGSNSRQRVQKVEIAWNDPAETRHDSLSRAVEISSARVVTKALPVLHHFLFRRGGEG